MGTLTADVPRLEEHCSHKLPSSCRLTSTPNCCACADNRPHESTYRKYIDGIGYVQRGVRWDHYCWFCYSFWEARVEASGLSPRQTRIPENPNQDEFTKRWFEFHQGYRTIYRPDGGEDRIAVIGEPFKDVDPGHLPRTLEELRSGQASEQIASVVAPQPLNSPLPEDQPSLEETLDQMLEDAIAEEEQGQPQDSREPEPESLQHRIQESNQGQASIHADRRSFRREIEANRQQIEAEERALEIIHRELDDNERDLAARQQRITEGQSRLEVLQHRLDTTQRILETDRLSIEGMEQRIMRNHVLLEESRVRLATFRQQLHENRQLQAAAATNLARVFGTREDIQSDDYVSPITSMFMRVSQWGRRNQPDSNQASLPVQLGESHLLHHGHNEQTAGVQQPLQAGQNQHFETPDEPSSRRSENSPRQSDAATALGPLHRAELLESMLDDAESMANYMGAAHIHMLEEIIGPAAGGQAMRESAGELSTYMIQWMIQNFPRRLADGLGPPTMSVQSVVDRIIISVDSLGPRDAEWENLLIEIERLRVHLPVEGWTADLAEVACNALRSAFDEAARYVSTGNRNPVLARIQSALRTHALSVTNMLLSDMETSSNAAIFEGASSSQASHTPRDLSFLARTFAGLVETPQLVVRGLDIGDDRPEPKTDEDMVAKLECRICLSQVADTACLPCGHLSMCRWCADQAIPTKAEDHTRPVRKGLKCPVCRENVKARVKIYVA